MTRIPHPPPTTTRPYSDQTHPLAKATRFRMKTEPLSIGLLNDTIKAVSQASDVCLRGSDSDGYIQATDLIHLLISKLEGLIKENDNE